MFSQKASREQCWVEDRIEERVIFLMQWLATVSSHRVEQPSSGPVQAGCGTSAAGRLSLCPQQGQTAGNCTHTTATFPNPWLLGLGVGTASRW